MLINIEHPCIYKGVSVESQDDDYSWSDRWVYWYDRFGRAEKARMKQDAQDHFYPNTKIIKEEDIIGWSESRPELKQWNESEPVRGLSEWVHGNDYQFVCNRCEFTHTDRRKFKYCPHCGCKMVF